MAIKIKRKTGIVKHLLLTDNKFKLSIGFDNTERCNVISWIADMGIKFGHEFFNGFLKVSIE